MCWRSNRKSGSPSQKKSGCRHISTSGLASSAPGTFLFCFFSGLYYRISSRKASLSPATAGKPVGEARFVRAILLPVRKPSLRRVFRDSDHADCLNRCSTFDNMKVLIFCVFGMKTPIQATKIGFLGDLTSLVWNNINVTTKGTNGCETTSFEPPLLQFRRDLKTALFQSSYSSP